MNRLLVKMEIDKRTDDIIEEVLDFFKNEDVKGAFGEKGNKTIGRSQLAGLLEDCKNAASVEEIKLYISYKKAKDTNDNKKNYTEGWNTSVKGQGSIADYLIKIIGKIVGMAEDIGRSAVENQMGNDNKIEISSDDLRQIKLMLCERFFGYLYWKGTEIASKGGR